MRFAPIAALLMLVVCGTNEAPPPQASAPPASFQPIATLQDLMAGEVDPSADGVWNSVATSVTTAGIDDHQPRTPQEWAGVRRSALRLLEATNLLLIEGRHVSATAFAAEAQGALGSVYGAATARSR